MSWNFDIEAAPHGVFHKVERKIGKNLVEMEEHIPALIIAAGSDLVVTVSKWLPKEERWQMFSKNTPPIAWQPFPKHPEEES